MGNDGSFGGDLDVDGITTLDQTTIDTDDGDFTVLGSNDIDFNVTGYISLDAGAASNFTTSTGAIDISGYSGINLNGNTGYIHILDTDQSPGIGTGALVIDGGASVGENLNINNDLNVGNDANINLNLHVFGDTHLAEDLWVDGVATFTDDVFMTQGDDIVVGAYNTGDLAIAGGASIGASAQIQNNLYVGIDGHVGQDLYVVRDEFVGRDGSYGRNVGIGTTAAPTNMALYVKGTGTYSGQHMALFENTQGGDADGVAIKINVGTPDTDNNFLTFLDSGGGARGCIEGQTAAEIPQDPYYILQTAFDVIDIILAVADVVAASTSSTVCVGLGACVTAPVPSLIVAAAANLVSVAGNAIAWQAYLYDNVGVSFTSGSGDYAEYLKRKIEKEVMEPGDIIGVFGGEITRSTLNAQQIMVISTAPIVLGNMPPESEEQLYEKVTFMGQIPVKVIGPVNIGDYIIPSGWEDGTGIAVAPEIMTPDEFMRVVGRAWSDSDFPGIKLINIAVGLNGGDVAQFVKRQNNQLQQTRSELEALKAEVNDLKLMIQNLAQERSHDDSSNLQANR